MGIALLTVLLLFCAAIALVVLLVPSSSSSPPPLLPIAIHYVCVFVRSWELFARLSFWCCSVFVVSIDVVWTQNSGRCAHAHTRSIHFTSLHFVLLFNFFAICYCLFGRARLCCCSVLWRVTLPHSSLIRRLFVVEVVVCCTLLWWMYRTHTHTHCLRTTVVMPIFFERITHSLTHLLIHTSVAFRAKNHTETQNKVADKTSSGPAHNQHRERRSTKTRDVRKFQLVQLFQRGAPISLRIFEAFCLVGYFDIERSFSFRE